MVASTAARRCPAAALAPALPHSAVEPEVEAAACPVFHELVRDRVPARHREFGCSGAVVRLPRLGACLAVTATATATVTHTATDGERGG